MKSKPECLHLEPLLVGCAACDTVGGGQQPAVAQHRRATYVTNSFYVKADLPGPLPFPGYLPTHDARAPVWPPAAIWSYRNTSENAPCQTAHKRACIVCGQRTAVFLIRAVFAVLLAVTVWVQLTDALPVAAAEGEL